MKILITFFTDINTKIQILKIKYTLFLTNPVPKDNSNDECFEDYLYAVLKDIQINLKYLCIALELLAVLIVGMIPATVDPLLSLYPIFFVTAFQWCVFKGALGYVSSTIFSTNNVKQTVVSLMEYLLLDDLEEKQEKLKKAQFFGGTLLSFHIGVALSCFACRIYSIHGIWLAIIILLVNLSYIVYAYNSKGEYIY